MLPEPCAWWVGPTVPRQERLALYVCHAEREREERDLVVLFLLLEVVNASTVSKNENYTVKFVTSLGLQHTMG